MANENRKETSKINDNQKCSHYKAFKILYLNCKKIQNHFSLLESFLIHMTLNLMMTLNFDVKFKPTLKTTKLKVQLKSGILVLNYRHSTVMHQC